MFIYPCFSVFEGKATSVYPSMWKGRTTYPVHFSRDKVLTAYSSLTLPKNSPLKVISILRAHLTSLINIWRYAGLFYLLVAEAFP